MVYYPLLKLYARLAIRIYCPEIVINKPELLSCNGPVLLAANHPNSFLDGIILTTLFHQPVYSLARGDAFKNPKIKKILNWLKLLPVYRTTEGIENLEHNYTTFETCQRAFRKQAVVLIFSEAGSRNEWHLRPIRKGTARLAVSSWEKGIDVKVLPTAINYNSFKSFGKIVHLYFGEFIEAPLIMCEPTHGKQLLAFNADLLSQLQQFVYEIAANDKETIRKTFYHKQSWLKIIVLSVPALTGFIIHLPFFMIFKIFTVLFFKHSDHYDSVLTSLLLLFYPLYVLLFILLLSPFHIILSLSSLFVLPFSSWAYMKLRTCVQAWLK
jgi:1-acyl-sn-glycerol-3-phosphate acyltransferase